MTITLCGIASALGGQVRGKEVYDPTPGHSDRDRGTAIRLAPGAPDGLLVHCFNGGWLEIAAIKDTLRVAGVLPEYDGNRRELNESIRIKAGSGCSRVSNIRTGGGGALSMAIA